MNKVLLLGRTGSNPEVKELKSSKVAKLSLATSETFKRNDEKVTETTWHSLVFWGKQCDVIKEYVHKGDQLLVEGKIQIRQYDDKNGVKHWATEIVCDRFELIGSSKKSEPKPETNEGKFQKSGKVSVNSMSDISELPGNVANYDDIPDDSIPF